MSLQIRMVNKLISFCLIKLKITFFNFKIKIWYESIYSDLNIYNKKICQQIKMIKFLNFAF